MSTQTELSTKVGVDVPVVMIQFNVDRRFKIPSWAEKVQDFKPEKAPTGENVQTGRKIIECQQVCMSHMMSDLDKQDYIPLRLVVIERPNGRSIRMVLVCVHKDHIAKGDRRMPRSQESEVRTMLSQYFWDERIFRNPDNFIVALGGFTPTRNNVWFATQRINDENEFELMNSADE